jgi:hypothetical protein
MLSAHWGGRAAALGAGRASPTARERPQLLVRRAEKFKGDDRGRARHALGRSAARYPASASSDN